MNILYKWNAQCVLRNSLKELKIQTIINLVTLDFKPVAHLTDTSSGHISFAQPSASVVRIYSLDFRVRTTHGGKSLSPASLEEGEGDVTGLHSLQSALEGIVLYIDKSFPGRELGFHNSNFLSQRVLYVFILPAGTIV